MVMVDHVKIKREYVPEQTQETQGSAGPLQVVTEAAHYRTTVHCEQCGTVEEALDDRDAEARVSAHLHESVAVAKNKKKKQAGRDKAAKARAKKFASR